jgi:hypothetical protein
MNRSLSRNIVVAATLVAMTFIIVPVASAGPSKVPAFKSPISWFEAPLFWLGKLPARAAEQLDRTFHQKRTDNTWGGPTITAHTGSCIDPDGNRIPCPGV